MAEIVGNVVRLDLETVRKLEERLERIRQSYAEEIKRLGIREAIITIVRARGRCRDSHCCDVAAGNPEQLMVWSNCTGIYYVWYKGEKVFELHVYESGTRVEVYKPGTWIKAVLDMAEAAKLQLAERELASRIRKLREEAEKLGVRLEDLICQTCD